MMLRNAWNHNGPLPFETNGHVWELDEDGVIPNSFATEGDYHNGPRCIKCGYACCEHCTTVEEIPFCQAPDGANWRDEEYNVNMRVVGKDDL